MYLSVSSKSLNLSLKYFAYYLFIFLKNFSMLSRGAYIELRMHTGSLERPGSSFL